MARRGRAAPQPAVEDDYPGVQRNRFRFDEDPERPGEPVDYRETFGANFTVWNVPEGEQFHRLSEGDIQPRTLDWPLLRRLGLDAGVRRYAKLFGVDRLIGREIHGFHPLSMEFCSTFKYHQQSDGASARLNGRVYEFDELTLNNVLGFHLDGATWKPEDWNLTAAWRELSDVKYWDGAKGFNSLLLDPSLCIIHKWLCYNIFGKREGSKINQQELYFLHCVANGHRVNLSWALMAAWEEQFTKSSPRVCNMAIISLLAHTWGVFNMDDVDSVDPAWELIRAREISDHELFTSKLITGDGQLTSHAARVELKGLEMVVRHDGVSSSRAAVGRQKRSRRRGASEDVEEVEEETDEIPMSEPAADQPQETPPQQSQFSQEAPPWFQAFQVQFDQRFTAFQADVYEKLDMHKEDVDRQLGAIRNDVKELVERWDSWTGHSSGGHPGSHS